MTPSYPLDATDVFPRTIGRCIYCDATTDLSDEHVVPYALGGQWLLKAASCARCRDVTAKVELRVLREHFLAIRTVAGFPTRRPRERPAVLQQKLVVGKAPLSLDMAPIDHPAPLALPIFAPPSGFDHPRAAIQLETIRVASRQGRLERLVERTRADQWTFPFVEPDTFARFVGKIGFCFAVGSYGTGLLREDGIRPCLRGDDDSLANWVGCREAQDDDPAPDGGIHLTAVVQNGIVVVDIRLFAIPGSPIYTILAGRASHDPGSEPVEA